MIKLCSISSTEPDNKINCPGYDERSSYRKNDLVVDSDHLDRHWTSW
jgi:hypothetical protein